MDSAAHELAHHKWLSLAVCREEVLHSLVAVSIFLMHGGDPDKDSTLQALEHRGNALASVRISLGIAPRQQDLEALILSILWLVPIEVRMQVTCGLECY
jgi:hypothetical protein